MTWAEVADGVFQRRYDPLDVTVGVIRGAHGLVLVDTRSSLREADELRTDLAVFAPLRARWVVNTHAHFDHCFGNSCFGPPIYGHERVPAHLAAYEEPMLAAWIAGGRQDLAGTVLMPPTELVGERALIHLGDRVVELLHLGRGHTDNDLLVHVADAATWLVGDLVEESGPPMFGSGCYPLEWPGTVARLRRRLVDDAVLIPGHGAPVAPAFAAAQQSELENVARLIRELHAAGVPASEALAEAADRWPYPPAGLRTAVARGFAQLD